MALNNESPLALSTALTTRTNALALGLEHGAADLLELVTPTTAELLLWWFGQDMVDARGGLNFHAGQKQAILNAIVAHEVLGAATLKDLYAQVAPDALLAGTRLAEVSLPKHEHPKYCFKMATGTGKTWVLQALLVWQLLNKTAALTSGLDDARFTRQFMVVAPGLIHAHSLKLRCCTSLVNPPSKNQVFSLLQTLFSSTNAQKYTGQARQPILQKRIRCLARQLARRCGIRSTTLKRSGRASTRKTCCIP